MISFFNIFENYVPVLPNCKLCIDTEHAWAQGIEYGVLKDFITKAKDSIALIHLNFSPFNIAFGSRIDLHSYTSYKVTSSRNHMMIPGSTQPEVYDIKDLLERISGIPTVFERAYLEIMLLDAFDMIEISRPLS